MKTGCAFFQKLAEGSSMRRTSSLACMLSIVETSAASVGTMLRSTAKAVLAKPVIQVLLYEYIVLEVRVCLRDAVDFFHLPGRQLFVRIEAPAAFQQSLPTKNFVNARDAAMKVVHGIEDGGVGVGHLRGERLQFGGHAVARRLGFRQVLDRDLCPDGPMPEQAASKTDVPTVEVKNGAEIIENVVVVARVERNFVCAAGFGEGANDVDRLIAIEGRDFDGDYVFDAEKLSPEFVRQDAASDRRLKVEAHHRENGGDRFGVLEEVGNGFVLQRGKAEERGVVSEARSQLGFGDGLGTLSADTGNFDDLTTLAFLLRELQDRFEQAVLAD